MISTKHKLNTGFTLIELLVVLVILGLLAGLVGPNVMKYVSQALVKASEELMGWNGPYLRKKKLPLDPWNNDYVYKSPGLEYDFDLFSYGADGEPEGSGDNSDISAWE